MPGTFITAEAHPLYLVGERKSPWLLNAPQEGHRVRGELFEVSEEVLRDMDILERVTEADGYTRCQIPVVPESGGQPIEAYVYLKDPALFGPVSEGAIGPLLEFTAEHAALYKPRSQPG